VEPENRLVARTLERAWEAALSEQAQLEAEYERLKRDKSQASSAAELAAIRELMHDLPALWRAETGLPNSPQAASSSLSRPSTALGSTSSTGFFSKLARSVLRHIRVASKQELKERIMAAMDDISQHPVVHTWSYRLDQDA
jgi:hypothetical protein